MERLNAKRDELEKLPLVDCYDMSRVVTVQAPTVVDEATRVQRHALTITGMDAKDADFARELAASLEWQDAPVSSHLVVQGPLTDVVPLHPGRSDAMQVLVLQNLSLGADVVKQFPKVEDVSVHDAGGSTAPMNLIPIGHWKLLKRLAVYASPDRGLSFAGVDTTKTALSELHMDGAVLHFPSPVTMPVSVLSWTRAKGPLCDYLESRTTPLKQLTVTASETAMPVYRLLTMHRVQELSWRDSLIALTAVNDEEKKATPTAVVDQKQLPAAATTDYRVLHLFSHAASVAFLSSRVYERLRMGAIESFGICTPLYSTLPALQLLSGQLIPWRMAWEHLLNENNRALRKVWVEVPQGSHLDDTFLYLKMLLDMCLTFVSRVPKALQPMTFTVNLRPHTPPTDAKTWTDFTDRLVQMYVTRIGIPARARLDDLLSKSVELSTVKVELDWMQMNCATRSAIEAVHHAIQTITDSTRAAVLHPLRQHHDRWLNYTVLTSTSIRANVSSHVLAIAVHS